MVIVKRIKAKFRFHFSDGFSMADRNKLKTLKQAKSFARNHNSAPTKIRSQFGGRIIKVTTIERKPTPARPRRGLF